MNKISFNAFKKETHHKEINFNFVPHDKNKPRKEFKSNKFYCNKYKGILSLPSFVLSDNGEFFQISNTEYCYNSEFGTTFFYIIERGLI